MTTLTPGTKEWLESSIRFANNTASSIKHDAIPFVHKCQELIQNKAWEQYFSDEPKTWERLCQEAIHGTDPAFIATIIKGVQILEGQGHEGAIPAGMAERVAKAEPLNLHGGDRKSEDIKSTLHSNLEIRGNSQNYLISRLKRDRPDIAEGLAQGKYQSVRAAALQAGIVQQRVSVAPRVESAIKFLTDNFSQDQIDEIIRFFKKEEN